MTAIVKGQFTTLGDMLVKKHLFGISQLVGSGTEDVSITLWFKQIEEYRADE
jgi:hypothetical protein